MLIQIGNVVFEQDQARAPACQIEAAEHFKLMPFDVDGEEFKPFRGVYLRENVIKSAYRNFDHLLRLGPRRHAVAIERGVSVSHVECHPPPRILSRGAGNGEDLRAPQPRKLLRKIGLRLDEHPAPAKLLEMPRLRLLLRPIRSDLDKET